MAIMKLTKGYLAGERASYAKGESEMTPHEKKESMKRELAEKKALKRSGGAR